VNWITGTSDTVPEEVARLMADRLEATMETGKRAILALPGGRSVGNVVAALLEMELDWSRIDVFFVDERCVPVEDAQSNYQALRGPLFDPLISGGLLPQENIHVPQRSGTGPGPCDPEAYTAELAKARGDASHPAFDVALLGVGGDGHVASLFPNHASVRARDSGFILVNDAPKPPATRISASRQLLERSGTIIALFLGDGKCEALRSFRSGGQDLITLPCRVIETVADAWAATDLV
jgi:6-phosphogluconolactonase